MEKKFELKKEFIEQAAFVSRGTEVLPGGVEELAKKLQIASETKTPLRVKLGLDPTRPDLHLGHSVVMRKLKQFQDLGHQVVLIVGGATAMVGDPSGKSETRPALTKEEVDANAQTYFDQMSKVVNIEKAEVTNNANWLHKMNLTDLLKLSSNVTVAQMMTRDDFNKRYSEGKPISVHEFFYPLMQAYDSVEIDADIELGGTDQRFNVLLGRDIQSAYGKKYPQMVMLLPLLEGTDGVVKMSKSYPENCISINEDPNNMFGKLMSIPDTLISRYYELLTDVSTEKIEEIKKDLGKEEVNPRDIKMELALEITTMYHSKELALKGKEAFINLFQKKAIPDDMDEIKVSEGELIINIIVENNMASSKGDAKRLIAGGGVKIDGEKISDISQSLIYANNNSLVLQVGKRKFLKLLK